MWSTPLIVVFALGLALPSQATLRAPAGPTDGHGQPGRSFFPLHPVAIMGAKSYRVLPLGLVPTVGVVFSHIRLSSGVALGAACNLILTSAHQKYAPTDDAEYKIVRGQNVGPLHFRADGPHSYYPVVAEGEEIFTGTTFAPTDAYAKYRDLRVFRTHTSALPGQSQVCQHHFQIASKAFMRIVTAQTAPFRVIVIAQQGVYTTDGPHGTCLRLALEKSREECEARNPHFPGAVYEATEKEAGLFLLACDTSRVGDASGSVVAVVDPAGNGRLIIVGVISASATAKGKAAQDSLPLIHLRPTIWQLPTVDLVIGLLMQWVFVSSWVDFSLGSRPCLRSREYPWGT